jgi:histidinol phosphatase-like enzyme
LDDVNRFNEELCRKLGAFGVRMSASDFFVCPHVPEDLCECRKPKPGLLFQARDTLNLDLARWMMIGDKESDVVAGLAAGCHTIRLPAATHSEPTKAHYAASSIQQAVAYVLALLEAGVRSSPLSGSEPAVRT